MLKDLTFDAIFPVGIAAILADPDINPDEAFKHYQTGVYRNDYYSLNFNHFINYNCRNKILGELELPTAYGVSDHIEQILEYHKDLVNDPLRNYVVGITRIIRHLEPSVGGWRWHKWGNYIGTQNPQCEYIYDEPEIEKVLVYSIYEID